MVVVTVAVVVVVVVVIVTVVVVVVGIPSVRDLYQLIALFDYRTLALAQWKLRRHLLGNPQYVQ